MSDPVSVPPDTSGAAEESVRTPPSEDATASRQPEPATSPAQTEPDPEGPSAAARRRRGSRGGRNRSRSSTPRTDDASVGATGVPESAARTTTAVAAGAAPTTDGPRRAPSADTVDGGAVAAGAVAAGALAAGVVAAGAVGETVAGVPEVATRERTATPSGASEPAVAPAAAPPADHAPPRSPRVGPGPAAGTRPTLDGPAAPRPKIGDSRPAPGAAPGPTLERSIDHAPHGARTAADNGNGARRAPDGSARPSAGPEARRRRRGSGRTRASERPDGEQPAGEPTASTSDAPRTSVSTPDARRTTTPVATVPTTNGRHAAGSIPDGGSAERKKGRERKGRPVGRYQMVVHVAPGVTQIAVLEGRSLIEHYVSRPSDDATQIDGNIYIGRVQNVLPGMEAAFVDIGTPKNAVLYRGDVRYDKDDLEGAAAEGNGKPTRGKLSGNARNARIEQLLKPGQTVLCQVTKNPIAHKGARLAQEVSLPGRFVVLIPNSDTYGISKRLADDERKRLRRILDSVRPEGHGLIVRTAAEGATPDELRRDVARLLSQWERIDKMARAARGPKLLYREPDMAVRVIREEFNQDYRAVIIDDRALYEEVRDYVASISPDLADRVELVEPGDDPLPLFERHHVHEQIHKALDRKVWLPSGGSLIIERTEALTVIDVNTGKNVGTSNLEETVFRNNLEAAEEIARQLRLRDIGGIIVIDFIDMEIIANRGIVARTFREALARDKTRTQVFDISELGLIEMTRKRISEGLVESFSQTCPTCAGRGFVLDDSLL